MDYRSLGRGSGLVALAAVAGAIGSLAHGMEEHDLVVGVLLFATLVAPATGAAALARRRPRLFPVVSIVGAVYVLLPAALGVVYLVPSAGLLIAAAVTRSR